MIGTTSMALTVVMRSNNSHGEWCKMYYDRVYLEGHYYHHDDLMEVVILLLVEAVVVAVVVVVLDLVEMVHLEDNVVVVVAGVELVVAVAVIAIVVIDYLPIKLQLQTME